MKSLAELVVIVGEGLIGDAELNASAAFAMLPADSWKCDVSVLADAAHRGSMAALEGRVASLIRDGFCLRV
jgi:hypothetical protein